MRKFGLLLASGAILLAGSTAHAQKRTYINPVDVDYRYNWEQTNSGVSYRTGADPVIVRHKDAYYLFQTLADGYWRSTNLIDWQFITPSMWPFSGVVAPAAISDGDVNALSRTSFTPSRTSCGTISPSPYAENTTIGRSL